MNRKTKINIRRSRLVSMIHLSLCTLVLTSMPVQAQDNYWIEGPGGGDWKFADNWSRGDVPADGENAFLINAGTVTLNMAQPTYPVPLTGSLQSLLMSGSTKLLHGGTYTLNIAAPPDPVFNWENFIWAPPAIGFGVNGTYGFSGGTLNSARTVVGVGGLFGPSPNFIPTNNPPLTNGGGLGVFTQDGGTANHGQLWVGFNTYGEYNLSGGTVKIEGYEMGTLVIGGKDWYGKTFVGEGVFNQTGGDVSVNGLGLFMADGSGTTGTYNLGPSGTLKVGGYYVIGGSGGTATFNQTGGTNTANGMLEVGGAGTGTYNLKDGNLITSSTIVGAWGTGTFNQGLIGNGGTHSVTGTMEVGSHGSGTYNLSAGNLNTGSTIVGNFGTGTFNQDRGSHVTGDLILAANPGTTGSYNLSGAPANSALNTNFTIVGQAGTGTFNQTGGTHAVTLDLNLGQSANSQGTYDLKGTGVVNVGRNLNVGVEGTGVFTQTGTSQVNVTGGVVLSSDTNGTGIGTYNLQGGSLTSGYTTVGAQGAGSFNQTGGLHTTGTLIVGDSTNGPGPGSYSLSGPGSQLNVSGNTTVGGFGDGTFTQTGGSHNVNILFISYGNVSGKYELGGGTLTANIENIGTDGTGVFTQTGGINHVVNRLNVGIGTQGETFGTGIYNLQNGTLNVGENSQVGVYGTGTFNQSGGTHDVGGTLYISKITGSSGTYNLSDGTLKVTGGIVNNDKFNFSGGILNANLTNNGTTTLSGVGTRTVNGDVTNNGTFKVTSTTAGFTGTFTNNGAYISDPSSNFFTDLIVQSGGYLIGSIGDLFSISGSFLNSSENLLWDTEEADLAFTGAGMHDFKMGPDGAVFIWDMFELGDGVILNLLGGEIWVDELLGLDTGDLIGKGIIRFNTNNPANDYLKTTMYYNDNGTITLDDSTSVPEPSSMLLLGIGLMGLAGVRRKFKN